MPTTTSPTTSPNARRPIVWIVTARPSINWAPLFHLETSSRYHGKRDRRLPADRVIQTSGAKTLQIDGDVLESELLHVGHHVVGDAISKQPADLLARDLNASNAFVMAYAHLSESEPAQIELGLANLPKFFGGYA